MPERSTPITCHKVSSARCFGISWRAKPGTLSRVALETFVDPRQTGGKLNARTTDDLVELMEIGVEEVLFYKAMPIDAALSRGTTADTKGSLTMKNEALTIDNLAQAMAAKNSGGIVMVEVENVVEAGSHSPRDVEIPGAWVDAVVIAKPGNYMQTFRTPFSPGFTGRFQGAHRRPCRSGPEYAKDQRAGRGYLWRAGSQGGRHRQL